jgi:hypothetical protein
MTTFVFTTAKFKEERKYISFGSKANYSGLLGIYLFVLKVKSWLPCQLPRFLYFWELVGIIA